MEFDIAPASPVPIYRQIVEQVRRLVAGGQLKPGEELPSVRAVAQLHAINPMTVSKAYSMLETEGLLVRRRGVGMAVADGQGGAAPVDKAALLRPALEAAAQTAHQLGFTTAEALQLFEEYLNRKQTHE
ncbi:GntR family transcriptional regulator [Pseudoduganella ginsengisoli]|uniref:GntR family transcriptional regulator n=1 Tax=Pseudoduganella ginsengisoli TaxID=1462440 RepID=A0A6L6PUM2_9BURK|nr:GntR family transcriptional regulator [Pseudoduganella ginsengisoli]MTW00698.1 GntR family transcriptional regulator [Pseudoduganella ginsengisoli]